MASVVEIVCPECDENLKVPPSVFGKKVKCKHCGHGFVVKDPDAKGAKPAKPGAKPAASPPPPAPAAKKNPFLDDDEDEANAKKIEVITDDEVARCPHCAKELDPPDAKVCIHCGFNNVTRAKAETKKTWAPSFEDWAMHLLPGILAVVTVISLIVWNIICYMKMREWMAGSFLEKEDISATGQKEFYVRPGFFICLSVVISILIIAPCVKYAYRRLYKEFTPPEQVKL
jgi:hypothetical protein